MKQTNQLKIDISYHTALQIVAWHYSNSSLCDLQSKVQISSNYPQSQSHMLKKCSQGLEYFARTNH